MNKPIFESSDFEIASKFLFTVCTIRYFFLFDLIFVKTTRWLCSQNYRKLEQLADRVFMTEELCENFYFGFYSLDFFFFLLFWFKKKAPHFSSLLEV